MWSIAPDIGWLSCQGLQWIRRDCAASRGQVGYSVGMLVVGYSVGMQMASYSVEMVAVATMLRC